MNQNTFCMAGGVARNPLVRLAKPITATIGANEHIAIVGPNGGGKSLFVDTLIGKYPLREGTVQYDFSPSATQTLYDNVKYIAFRDTYGAADANYYYQQRWNAHDQDEAPDVREMLGEIKDEQLQRELFELFRIEPLLDKKIILLSSGELRKFQLTKTLLTAPRVLIMDNPFIGLDAPTRELLFSLLERLTKMSSVQIILVLSMLDDIPSFITHVIPVDKMEVFPKMEREAYLEAFRSRDVVTRKRGTGESIWEIKKHIGYVSPEMHRAYLKNLPAIEIVASGLHDSIGLYKRPQPEQMAICEWWMDIFGIADLKDKPFLQLSSGEQRLSLLARAFVKDPELLILDEPLHGLDTYNRRRVKKVIEAFCRRKDKTMIMVTHYESELPNTITDRIFLKRNR